MYIVTTDAAVVTVLFLLMCQFWSGDQGVLTVSVPTVRYVKFLCKFLAFNQSWYNVQTMYFNYVRINHKRLFIIC